MAKPFKAALLQMHVEPGDRQRNLDRAAAMIARAAEAGARLALLPEAMDLGWGDPSCRTRAEPVPAGATCVALADAARRHAMVVCAGLVEKDGPRVYNSAVILGPSGELLLLHRKLNELVIVHDCYDQGDRLGVCRTDLGTLGLMICADAFATGQTVARTLGYMGAEVILAPGSWAVPTDYDNVANPYGKVWRDNYKPVARDFRLWIMGVSNVGRIRGGPWGGRPCIGNSLVIDPDGREALEGPYGVYAESLLMVDVAPEPRPARGHGWADHWAR